MVNVIDKTQQAGFGDKFGELGDVQGVIIHHTGGGGDVDGVINTFQERGLPAQYVIDQQGNVYQTLPDGAKGQQIVNGSDPATGKPLNNSNTVGIEIIGSNDGAWTSAQIKAAQALTGQIQQEYGLPSTAVYGHSEVNPKDRTNEGAALAQSIRTGQPYSFAGQDPYAGNPFGVKPPVETASYTPPEPNLRPGDAGGSGVPPLYANGGLYGASAFAPAPQLASYSPQSPFDSVLFGNGAFPSNPLPPPPDQAVASNQMPAPTQQASSWLPSSLQQGGQGYFDVLNGGQSPPRTVNMAEGSTVPAGPYGAQAVVNAAIAGDPAALKAAMDAVLSAALSTDHSGIFGTPSPANIQSSLQNYFNTVQQQAPGAVRQVQAALATNPLLNAAVPDQLRPMLNSAFNALPPQPTAQLPLPNLRPDQQPPLVASNPVPSPGPTDPAIPQLASYGTSNGGSQDNSAADQSPFSVSAMGTLPQGFEPPAQAPSIGSFGSSGYNSPPSASGGFSVSTMNNGPSSFDAPPAETDPFSVSATGNDSSPSAPLPFGGASSDPVGYNTSPVDQFSFSNYAPPASPSLPPPTQTTANPITFAPEQPAALPYGYGASAPYTPPPIQPATGSTPVGNSLLGFGSPLASNAFTGGIGATPSSAFGSSAFLANGAPQVGGFTSLQPPAQPKPAPAPAPAPRPAPRPAVVMPRPQPTQTTVAHTNPLPAPVAASQPSNDYPSIPSGSTLMGQYNAGTGGASYNTSQYYDPSANAVMDTYVDDSGQSHTTNLTNDGYQAPDYTIDQYSANYDGSNATDPANNGASSDDASGTVLCTFFYRKGRLSRRLWLADARYARTLSHRVRRGYWKWAIPTVRRLQRGSPILEVILWHVVVRPWAHFAGWKMNLVRTRPLSGAFVHLALGAFSWALGK